MERHEIIEKNVSGFMKYIKLKVKEFHDLITTKVKTIDRLFLRM